MQNKNTRPFIALAILVVAVAVVWAFWPKQKAPEQSNQQQKAQDVIPAELVVAPAVGTVVSFDSKNGELIFTVKDEEYTGRVTEKTNIIKQVKDKVGAMSITTGKTSDITKNAKVLVVPKPTGKAIYDLKEVQIAK